MNKKNSEICAIIPARSGSKGVPDKNIKLIDGIPLLAYSIRAALESRMVDRVIVSTDSPLYKKIAEKFGAEVPFLRPDKISQDESIDFDFFDHAINWMKENEGHVPKYFAHLRPTTPLRDPKIIDKAIKILINSDYTSLRSVNLMSKTAYKSFEIKNNVLVGALSKDRNIDQYGLSRQSYPSTYEGNGYIDVVRSELISKNRLLHGDKAFAFLTEVAYEIDEMSDLAFIEFAIEQNQKIVKRLFGKA